MRYSPGAPAVGIWTFCHRPRPGRCEINCLVKPSGVKGARVQAPATPDPETRGVQHPHVSPHGHSHLFEPRFDERSEVTRLATDPTVRQFMGGTSVFDPERSVSLRLPIWTTAVPLARVDTGFSHPCGRFADEIFGQSLGGPTREPSFDSRMTNRLTGYPSGRKPRT